jgi:hypothetical protein
MGCTLPCCDDSPSADLKDLSIEFPEDEHKEEEPHSLVQVNTPVRSEMLDIDLSSPVFKGTTAMQKFSNKSTYDSKYLWINVHNRTLNLSEYNSKEKRHKEASIGDIVNVVAGPPEKYKPLVDEKGEAEKLNIGQCLSVTFVRGGGIDLKFLTEAERDAWYIALTKLMAFHRNATPQTQEKPTVGMSAYQ